MTSPSDVDTAVRSAVDTTVDLAAEQAEAAAVEDLLGRLIARGFKFVHPRDAEGELIAIVGVRVHGAVVDVVRFDSEDEVSAMRMPADEADILAPRTLQWRRDGDMHEVVDALLDLPDVSETPPQRRAGGRGCWVGGNRGQSVWLRASA
ncbi:hypothetical protein ACWGPQ_14525 [Saccharomonospora azurea]|uniref:hypothetical protein n=1 Tax=Saccharomonospora azurea TaxID=40988 RepID=UPI0002400F22|nr:hypothetical protein [Saccharomonospora azurea]EHK89093.1 hypothetical protein SZMC14600_01964 [Saccharomonospora azurea SZMC 14600]